MCMERRRFLKQWLPNGKLLLLSLTKCHGVPCSLPSRITTKALKNCKTNTETKTKRSRPRPRLHDPRPRPRPRLSLLSSRRLETKTLVSRTTSLHFGARGHQHCCHNHENLFLSKVINHFHHLDKWNTNYNCATQASNLELPVKTFYRSNAFLQAERLSQCKNNKAKELKANTWCTVTNNEYGKP